jgi:hypothetical protein
MLSAFEWKQNNRRTPQARTFDAVSSLTTRPSCVQPPFMSYYVGKKTMSRNKDATAKITTEAGKQQLRDIMHE